MKACIMCGGTGTRLRPLTFRRPKPAIPLLNTPSVIHLIEHLSREGFNEIIITLGYMGEDIEKTVGDGSVYGVHIDYVYEKEKLGTAGSIKNAQEKLGDEPFIVVGGDHVMTLNLREMYRFHKKRDSIVTIGLLSIDDPREFGIANMDIDYKITRFHEKPNPGEIFSNLASTGIYVCSPEIFDWIPENTKYDFAKDLFPKLLKACEKEGEEETNNKKVKPCISGILVRGKWTDVGSASAYRSAQKWMLDDMPGTSIEGYFSSKNAKIQGPLKIGNNVTIGNNSSISGPIVIGENTTVGNNVLIGPYSVIGSNCVIGNNSKILASNIFDGVKVGDKTTLSGAIVDSNTVIGKECSIENGTIIGPDVKIKNNVTVHSGVKVWPEIEIAEYESVKEDIFNDNYETGTGGS
ncbi:MAG: NDP-sugar synthase [Methanosarcinaceae archaeon]|nr:NDP-sugar synthase [Methanosarcinaceae archaeon]